MKKTIGMRVAFLAVHLLLLQVWVQAQKPITWKDVPGWKSLTGNGAVLSPDGKWVAYGIAPVEGDGELFLQKNGRYSIAQVR